MIDGIELKNFRGFGALELKQLNRVNLIVGPNNAGKTSLLEGLFLLCDPKRVEELPGLFRPEQGYKETRYFRWLLKDASDGAQGKLTRTSGAEIQSLLISSTVKTTRIAMPPPNTLVRYRNGASFALSSHKAWSPQSVRTIPIRHPETAALVSLVGKAYRRSGGEETIQSLLAKIDPRIKKIRIDPGENDGNQIIVDIGLSELVPISQVGQGVFRLLSILADVVGEKPSVVLIDEIENGLHHSVMEQVWAGLAETAQALDVQIFATTHSNECLEAAHAACSSRSTYELSVIQLFRVESGVQGRVLDRKLIQAANDGDIDLR